MKQPTPFKIDPTDHHTERRNRDRVVKKKKKLAKETHLRVHRSPAVKLECSQTSKPSWTSRPACSVSAFASDVFAPLRPTGVTFWAGPA